MLEIDFELMVCERKILCLDLGGEGRRAIIYLNVHINLSVCSIIKGVIKFGTGVS